MHMIKFLSLVIFTVLSFNQSIQAQICDPPQVDIVTSNVTVTVGASATMQVSATGSTLSYKWQVSTNGGTSFTDLSNGTPYSGVTSAVLNIANVTATLHNSKYRCVVSTQPACESTSGITTLVVNSAPLCSSTATVFGYEYVNSVILNGITFNGNTNFSGPGYYNYTGVTIPTVTAGTSIPISVKAVTNGPYQQFIKVWIDFNRDGIPGSEPTELVFDQNHTFTGNHTFPEILLFLQMLTMVIFTHE